MLTQYTLKVPHGVYSGRGAPDHVKGVVEKCAAKVTVFSGRGIIGAGLLERPLSLIRETGVEYLVLDGLPAEPNCGRAQAIISGFEAKEPDLIMAAGGESAVDIAKLTSMLATDVYTARDLLDSPGLVSKYAPTLMIPTMAGISSKVTSNSIMAVPEKELGVGIVNDAMIADCAILDGEMIRHLPGKIVAITRVDTLAHGIEYYTFSKAGPFNDTFALETPGLTFNRIKRTCDDPNTLGTKDAILIAVFYAGAVIIASETTAIYTLSYPLGDKYHIPHGISNVMLFTPVVRSNEPACRECLATVYDRMAKGGRESGLPSEEKSTWIVRCLNGIVKHLGIPNSLKEYGIGDEGLDVLVGTGMDVERLPVNNMREVTTEDVRKLCLEIMRQIWIDQ